MEVIIDKLVANYAVVELPDRTYELIPRRLLWDAKEGDVVEIIVKPNRSGGNEDGSERNQPELVLSRG